MFNAKLSKNTFFVKDYEYIGTVGYKEIVQGDAQQLWKKEGNHLISQYNGAILGAHETEGLVAISGDSDTIIPVSINEDASTSFEFSVPGNNLIAYLQTIFEYEFNLKNG